MDEKCDAKNVIIYKDEKNLIADVIKNVEILFNQTSCRQFYL
jgi:hypothetical protein